MCIPVFTDSLQVLMKMHALILLRVFFWRDSVQIGCQDCLQLGTATRQHHPPHCKTSWLPECDMLLHSCCCCFVVACSMPCFCTIRCSTDFHCTCIYRPQIVPGNRWMHTESGPCILGIQTRKVWVYWNMHKSLILTMLYYIYYLDVCWVYITKPNITCTGD